MSFECKKVKKNYTNKVFNGSEHLFMILLGCFKYKCDFYWKYLNNDHIIKFNRRSMNVEVFRILKVCIELCCIMQ